ncbi:MAG: hybrid sensor histidine kinase/response regulator [Chloroflexota bacterium]
MTKILVIEDEIELREAVADWLQFEDFTVFQAGNGRNGIAVAVQELPDIIISDVMMPELDGYQVLQEMRARPETAVIPFIFLTALADRRELRHGMEMGADDYLTKPFTRDELLNAIHSRLERQSVNRQQVEQALDELRQTILRTLPHELRTPLTGILGLGEILAHSPEDLSVTDLQEMGQLTLDAGNRLLRLVENYQYFVEIEFRDGVPPDEAYEVEASGLMREISATLAVQYDRVNDLHVLAESATLKLDPRDWAKIIFELVDNAFKFSPPGTAVRINGWRINDDPLAPRYQLSVADLGVGFMPEHVSKIGGYMQFNRKKREQQGSGLGLAIVKRLAQLFGATVEVVSEVNKGTTITFSLPLT